MGVLTTLSLGMEKALQKLLQKCFGLYYMYKKSVPSDMFDQQKLMISLCIYADWSESLQF